MADFPMLDLVDYGGGNIGSVRRCLDRLDARYQVVNQALPPTGKNPLVFPGVGAFGAAMQNLRHTGLDQQIQTLVNAGTPYLGICIGLQVLLEGSEEAPGVAGLGLIPGQVVRFQRGKVPQIGWNRIQAASLKDLPTGYVYFVNSYYPQPKNPQDALYVADYEGPFCAAVQRGNITAFQFHPEKSGMFGHNLIRRWLRAL